MIRIIDTFDLEKASLTPFTVAKSLLDAVARGMVAIFRLNYSNWQVIFVVENVIGSFFRTSRYCLSANIDASCGKRNLLTYLSI